MEGNMVHTGSKEEPYKGWAKHIFGSKEFAIVGFGPLFTGLLIPIFLEQSQNYQK
jgi:hypothetical protein